MRFLAPQISEFIWDYYFFHSHSKGYRNPERLLRQITSTFICLATTCLLYGLMEYEKDGKRSSNTTIAFNSGEAAGK
jgi:Domain of unknown function (DUF6532)